MRWCSPALPLAALAAFAAVASGCPADPATDPAAVPARTEVNLGPPPPGEDLGELLTDVEHLLTQAAADHKAFEAASAQEAWRRAWTLLARYHIERLRVVDPVAALRLEYGMGQVRDALGDTRETRAALQRPTQLVSTLRDQIEAERPRLTAIHPVPPAAQPAAASPPLAPAP